MFRPLLLVLVCIAALDAQAPPAPGVVGLGGLVQISGLNLGPARGTTTSGTPWATKLADVEVGIVGKSAPAPAANVGAMGASPLGNLFSANAPANTVSAVAYDGHRQVGIIVVRVP